ncbi:hypothetical protein LUZ60_001578 [Juncus effusus]|nr:hypothetical protein LUZ60_001578 [Juncus effusus]
MAAATNATLQTLLLILVFLSLPSLHKARTNQERETLLSFLSSLSTPIQSWKNTNNSNCCSWEGITCDISSSVTQLSLPSKGLTGQISPVLSNLTNLSYLNLSHNSLFGQLPHELLSLLTNLTILDISFNSLSGPIPSSRSLLIQVVNLSGNFFNGSILVINSTSLVSLNMSNNSLTGPIPTSICTLSPFLTSLDISYNKIDGEISEEIGNCSVLKTLQAGYNKLTGSLPAKLFTLVSLQHLCLPSNWIEGSLNGYPIRQLTNLITLDLSTNNLTGFIPASIGQLKNLQFLLLSTNNLTGTIPSEISNCTGIKQLSLRANNLTGDLQSINFTGFSSLTQLDLYSNNFTGTIPSSIYTCTDLNALRLSYNSFHGEISSEIQNLKNLSFLSLGSNNFKNLTGTLQILSSCKNLTALLIANNFLNETIPAEPNWEETGFQNIQMLSFGSSKLNGEIPKWLSKMSKLKVLDLSKNRLTGPVPAWIGSFPGLFYLDLSSNYLSGNIPQQITVLPLLNSDNPIIQLDPGYLELPIYTAPKQQYKQLTALPPLMNLSNNYLNGTIPIQIGRLRSLQILDLSHNNITGQIPDPLGNLTNLETLDLSRNDLTGLIPVSLTRLHFLAAFSVAFNDLQGPIPTEGQFNTFSNSSYEGNPNLCGTLIMRPCNNNNGPSNGENDLPLSSKGLYKLILSLTFGIFFGVVAIVLIFGIFFVVSTLHPLLDTLRRISFLLFGFELQNPRFLSPFLSRLLAERRESFFRIESNSSRV